jgi:hypothetical protein
MPYANNGTISQSPLADGIEITEQQYAEGLNGMLDGKLVTIEGGFAVVDPPEPEPEPVPEPDPLPPRTIFSVREFRSRFTHAEQVAIRAASMIDMDVGLVYDDFQAAQYIDIEDPAVAAGIDLYISKELLEPGRKTALLTPETMEQP